MLNRLLFIGFILLFFSCGKEKIIQLPEIQNASITEVLDVSPAYIFYDETKQDSVELNRKNLIISTNWLVNVDKRLTLEQALPSIIKLQDKKRNAKMHKNEKARNYFTCNDTSIKNLGFIDFTEVDYIFSNKKFDLETNLKITDSIQYTTDYKNDDNVFSSLSGIHFTDVDLKFGFINDSYIICQNSTTLITEVKKSLFDDYLNLIVKNPSLGNTSRIHLHFSSSIKFQEYISIKSELSKLENRNIIIDNNEFIY